MNILVVTPLYYIADRENLKHDTNAIHYLIRPWANEHNVKVVNIYINTIRDIGRYINKKERDYYKKGYFYSKDNVDIAMIEVQNGFKQKRRSKSQNKRIEKFVQNYLKKNNFEPELIVYHIPSSTGCLSESFFSQVPKVAVLHETDRHIYGQKPKYANELKLFRSVYCRSNKLKQYFMQLGIGNIKEEIVYSGAPIEYINERKCQKPECFQFLYAGKLIARKGIDVSIRALATLQDKYKFRMDIYGEGKELKQLKKMADCLFNEQKIFFHGFVKREEVLKLMNYSDIFLMPSTGETFGLVYVEAMSQGCIPIGVKGEGIDGVIISEKNGFLVKKNNVKDLAICIERIITMEQDKYCSLVSEVQVSGQKFSEDAMGYKYLELITSENSK